MSEYIPDLIEQMGLYQEKFIEGDKVRCARCRELFDSPDTVCVDNWGTPMCRACADREPGNGE